MLVPVTVERVIERNARLVVALRRVAAKVHADQHHYATRWSDCQHELCRLIADAIDKNDDDEKTTMKRTA